MEKNKDKNNGKNKTKEQLAAELDEARCRVKELEALEASHKQTGEALQESEALLNEVCSIAGFGGWEMDMVTRKAIWTKGLYDMVEKDYKEPAPGPDEHLDYYLPEYRPLVRNALNKLVKEGEPLDFEAKYRTAKGNIKWCHICGKGIRKKGKCIKIFGTAQDITERYFEQEKHQRIVETALDGFCLINSKGKILEVNKSYCEMTGYSQQELLDMSVFDLEALEQARETTRHLKDITKQGFSRFETRHKRKDGGIIDIEVSVSKLETNKDELFAFLRDITERKLTANALMENEERFRLIAENSNELILRIQLLPEFKYDYISPSSVNILGYRPEEFYNNPNLGLESIHPEDRDLFKRVQSLKEYKPGESFVLRRIRKSGRVIWTEETFTAIYNEEGKASAIHVIARDVTQRILAEQAVRRSEEKYETIVEKGNDGIIIIQEGIVKFANNKVSEVTGFTPEESLGRSFIDFIAPESRELVVTRYKSRMAGDKIPDKYEANIIAKNKGIIIVEISASIIEYEGKPADMAIIRDITQRKITEEEIIEERNKLDAVIKSLGWGLSIVDRDFNITYMNNFFKELYGDKVGSKCYDIFQSDDIGCKDCPIRTAFSSGELVTVESSLVTPEGQTMYLERIASPIRDASGNVSSCVEIVKDITERKNTESALMESEERFRTIFNAVSESISISDMDGNYIDVNNGMLKMFGFDSKEEVVGKSGFSLVDPSMLEGINTDRINPTEIAPDFPVMEIPLVRKDGTKFSGENSSRITYDKEGKPKYLVSVLRNVTERKKAEEALRTSEEKLRLMFSSVSDGILSLDLNGIVLDANDKLLELHGLKSKDEIIGKNGLDFIAPEDHQKILAAAAELLKTGISGIIEVTALKKGGSSFAGEISISVMKDAEGKPVSFIDTIRDITGQKLIEQERQKIDRLESIGTLAGGIAHDFNNILTGILGNISLAQRYLEPESKAYERMAEAEKASLRARNLTSRLLTFAKGGEPIIDIINIPELLKESVAFALRGSNVRCSYSLPDNLWSVKADEGQINQVMTNIVINADQAMPRGGTLKIAASNKRIGDDDVLPLSKGNYVLISIQDNGCGIPPEDIENIFEPYFTTKHGGSGLGLTSAFSIIKNHQGHIMIESELGIGTTFNIYLPASTKKAPMAQESLQEAPISGGGKILIMDDEEVIRLLLKNILNSSGFSVDVTSNGAEAIKKYAKAKKMGLPYDAIIMDLTIPGGMGGKEAIRILLDIDPGVKAIVSSGYSNDPIMANFKDYGFSGVVAKPYKTKEVEKTINDVLAS